MSNLFEALLLGGYVFLVLPAVLLLLMTLFDRSQNPEQPSRGRLLGFLVLATLVLALLNLLIWLNPYGSEINSSVPAIGVSIVLDALLVYLLICRQALARLWATDRVLVAAFAGVFLGLLVLLAVADPMALLFVLIPTLALAFILYLARTRILLPAGISLLVLAVLIYTSGGWIYLTPAGQPAWSQTVRTVLTGVALLLAVLLPAGLLHASLRVSSDGKKTPLVWTLILGAILLAGIAYQGFWEGIWSSAHGRALEDHLPFIQFLLALIAGMLLALTLVGYRKWTGPLYTVLVTTVAVVAFTRGWNVSAFEMTERRAAALDRAITSYYNDHGVYPESLAELTPRYLLFVSPPVVVRIGGWCYQSLDQAYRLGYISGDFTYFTSKFKVETYSRAGEAPPETWACDDLRARFDALEFIY